jgi:hypothetical protein
MDLVRQMLLLGGLLNILSGLLAMAKPDVFRLLDKRDPPFPVTLLFVPCRPIK